MLAHSQDFKEAITRFGRDIKIRIGCYKGPANIKTEDNKLLLTENNLKLISDIFMSTPVIYYTEDDIFSITKNNLGELLRTYMKSFDIKTEVDFNIGERLRIEVGTTVNNNVEYLDYGIFYVYSKNYNKSEKCYEYTVCDEMIKTMIPYKSEYVTWVNNTTRVISLMHNILEHCGVESGRIAGTNFPNMMRVVTKDMFEGIDITCRDILDNIMQLSGCSLYVRKGPAGSIAEDEFWMIEHCNTNTIVDTIDEDILKDSKVDFKEKFGPINAVATTRSGGIDSVEVTDDTSIEENGKCEYVIKDNLIADKSEERDSIVDELLNGLEVEDGEGNTYRTGGIKGLEYYENDIDTIGLGYIEYLDTYNVEVDGQTYKCKCLKNVATIDGGMTEEYQGEPPAERTETYENIGKDDKTASITMDKLKGEIVLKAKSNGSIAQVRLDGNVEDEGSLVEITADNINLNGYTKVNSGFSITNDGTVLIDKGYITIDGDIDYASIWVRDPNTTYYSYIYPDHTDVTDGINSNVVHPDYTNIWSTNSNNKIELELNTSGTPYIYLYDGTKQTILDTNYIYTDGDLNVQGQKNRVVDIGDKKVLMNAYETATPYFGDIGSDKTDNNGECKIEIDKIFAKTVTLDNYKVFIQECGEGKLYVEKYNDYFIVKGTPNLSFDYEIKALQKGYENIRMKEFDKEVYNGRN